MLKYLTATLALILAAAACGGEDAATTQESSATTTLAGVTTTAVPTTTTTVAATTTTEAAIAASDDCAHVIDAAIEAGDGGFTVAATVLSADTGWEKYADAWQVWGPGGEVLGERILTHPHENEQPFTRSLSGIDIPDDVAEVTIAARDLVLGFCGDVFTVAVPRS